MNIILGDGLYNVRSAGVYQRATLDKVMDLLTNLSFDLWLCEDQNAVDEGLTTFYTKMQSMLREIIPVTEVHYEYTPGDEKPFGCPGFLYFQTAISELQRYEASDVIAVILDQNDGTDDWLVFGLASPRNIGYTLNADTFGGDPTVITDYLIFQPSPDGPGLEAVPYIQESAVKTIGIRLPKFSN